ncbi:MAG: tetratricopeptide repeat protein, partial [Magnetococcales bacterium]|nr:tetratricopeptide repeat protein [Magnetococcales bacterium]
LALGLAALFFSSAGAFFLVLCRLPGVSLCSGGGFATLLVYHVDFAVLVWFLAMAGVYLSSTGPAGRLEWPALLLAWIGAFALLLAPAQGPAPPILANYFPVLANPLFLGGMAAMGLGALLLVVNRLLQGADALGVVVAALAMLCALVVFVLTGAPLVGSPQTPEAMEKLFWAGGHLLQHAHVLLLASLWLWLQGRENPEFTSPGWLQWLFMLALLPSLAGIFLTGAPPEEYTRLMRWTSWWVVPGVAWVLARQWRASGLGEPFGWLSLLLLLLGLGMGVVVREQTLLVPAHYHGAVGAVTLGYMGLTRRLFVEWQVAAPGSRLDRWQPLLFAAGVVLLVVGLAVAGFSGLPRKTPGMDHPWEGAAALGMVLAAIGGLISAASSLWFVVRAVPLWWRVQHKGNLGLFAMTALGIAAIAAVLEGWPTATPPPAVVPPPRQTELERRFQQGVIMLHAKQYEHALTSFHWVLKQAPKMAEAHVNLGFALLGLNRVKAAEDFFRGAIELRPFQANAYYGLAQTLEVRGELREALGAMRTFIHLTRSDDPFLPRARAALWEWESRLKGAPQQTPQGPPRETPADKPHGSG